MRKPVYAICEKQRCRSACALRCLIIAFVVRSLHSIVPELAKSKISRLASLCSYADRFMSYLVQTPEDRFSRDVAHMSRLMTKPTKWHVRPAMASAWGKLWSLAINWAHSEDSDQTGRMPRLIWVFAGRIVTLLVLSWGGSYLF